MIVAGGGVPELALKQVLMAKNILAGTIEVRGLKQSRRLVINC